MSNANDPVAQLRGMSTEELVRLGQQGLRQRLADQATLAHLKYGGLPPEKLEAFLADPDCVRYPTRLVFEFGEMAMHQFAQPERDLRNTEAEGRVLYLRPILRDQPKWRVIAVAYMVPSINYGDVVSDEECLLYGATLLGLMQEEFYAQVCALADFVGAEVLTSAPGSGCP